MSHEPSRKPPSTFDNAPPTALVTGGSRGIGLGIALSLAKEGYRVAINGMRPDSEIQEVLDQIIAAGAAEALYIQGDVGSQAGRHTLLERLRSQFESLNLLVNNAGVAPSERKDVLATTPESYQRVMQINLEGPYFLTQSIANWMIERQEADTRFRGAVVNINSISATVVSTNRGEYCVSKAGLAMVTQLFATRLGEFGIPVYEIRPGITKTDMTAAVSEKYDQLITDGLCVTPRWGVPEDIGKAVASLARGDFPYSTGQTILIDGGLTIPRL
ncbi:MAG: 3-ketoacyl-ACP reductase [Verrucomicrobiales bacterium]